MAFKKGQSGNPKGKPKGAISKPRISDYMTVEDVSEIVKKAIELAKGGNESMIKLLVEQKFGKAVQPHEGDLGGGKLVVSYDSAFTPPQTKTDSV